MVIGDLNEMESKYSDLLENSITIEVFERWIYQSKEIQSILSSDDYLDLVSLNYNSKYIYYEIKRIMDKYIDHGKVETLTLIALLKRALHKDEQIGDILRVFYEMYCDGYYFLNDLGLRYGLSCEVPSYANSWEELSDQQRLSIINSFYPQLEHDLQRVLNLIESKKIILTGTKNDLNQWQYIDKRTEDEKKSTVWMDDNNRKGLRYKIWKTYCKKHWWNFRSKH